MLSFWSATTQLVLAAIALAIALVLFGFAMKYAAHRRNQFQKREQGLIVNTEYSSNGFNAANTY